MSSIQPAYRSVPLHDKSIVLNLAEDVKAVADVTAHINTQRDLRAAAQVMLETIDAAYDLREQLEQTAELRSLLRTIIERGDFYSPGHSDEQCVRAVQKVKALLDA